MPNSSDRRSLRSAAVLGAASGLRTTAGLAALAARGRWGGVGRVGVLTAAAGEIAGDKLPSIPPRSDAPALAGRAVAAAVAGRELGGSAGAGAAAAGSLATTYASERLRAALGTRVGLPDPALGVIEDAVALAIALAATRPSRDSVSDPVRADDSDAGDGDGSGAAAASGSPVADVARGLAAAAVGTAAMTSVQVAYLKLTGGSPSSAPERVGRRLIEGALHRTVPRRHRDALNQGMHILYGTSWGVPFGLIVGRLHRRPPAAIAGAALGVTAWIVSLVELPALDVAPPPWRQPPLSLASDLAFHLVYGGATAATFQVLAR